MYSLICESRQCEELKPRLGRGVGSKNRPCEPRMHFAYCYLRGNVNLISPL